MMNREELVTHHELDREALATWVYPPILGTIRDYQYSMIIRGLSHHLLIALSIRFWQLFIATTVILDLFR